jgi:hypothetical protein
LNEKTFELEMSKKTIRLDLPMQIGAQGYDSITAVFFFKQPWCALIVGCMFWSVYLETSSSSGCHTPGAGLAWRCNEQDEKTFELEMSKKTIRLDLPMQIGCFVYQYSKLRMLQFYYDFVDVFVDHRDFQYCAIPVDCISKRKSPPDDD